MKRKHGKRSLWAALCLLIVLTIPGWLAWRRARQQWLNQELFRAIQDRQVEKVRTLLDAGADANAKKRSLHGVTLEDVVRNLLLHPCGGGSQSAANDSTTALTLAVGAGQADAQIVTALLQKGADPNVIVLPEAGWPLLHYAAQVGSPDLVRQLLQAGARINAKDKAGETALRQIDPPPLPSNIMVTGASTAMKPFQDMPATHWAYQVVTLPTPFASDVWTGLLHSRQTHAQRQAIIRILQEAGASTDSGRYAEGRFSRLLLFRGKRQPHDPDLTALHQ